MEIVKDHDIAIQKINQQISDFKDPLTNAIQDLVKEKDNLERLWEKYHQTLRDVEIQQSK